MCNGLLAHRERCSIMMVIWGNPAACRRAGRFEWQQQMVRESQQPNCLAGKHECIVYLSHPNSTEVTAATWRTELKSVREKVFQFRSSTLFR
jgi:hypothetical protein